MQLFSTVSVQYVPTWSKETVALLRKVSPALPGARGPRHEGLDPASCPRVGSAETPAGKAACAPFRPRAAGPLSSVTARPL